MLFCAEIWDRVAWNVILLLPLAYPWGLGLGQEMTEISFRLEVEQSHVYLLNLQLQMWVVRFYPLGEYLLFQSSNVTIDPQ